MNGKILWKFVLSALIFAWAVSTISPVKDTPFEQFIVEEAGIEQGVDYKAQLEAALAAKKDKAAEEAARKQAFASILAEAQALVDGGKQPSVYVALGRIAKERKLDISSYFPQYTLADVPNLDKRNTIMLRELLRRSQGRLRFGLDLAGGVAVTFKANESQLAGDAFERGSKMDKAREIISRRVDSLGVAEPVIRLKGDDRIEVQMPGVSTRDNPDIISTIGKPAVLEFCLVHRSADARSGGAAPLGYRRLVEERDDPKTGRLYEVPYFVKSIPEMTGKSVKNARAAMGQFGGNEVLISFTDEGSKRFADLTRHIAEENARTNSVGQLAIILDGKLQSAPSVREAITGGSASITGSFSQREAIDLANVLENPLEVGLIVDEMSEVGPTLAAGAKEASYGASVIGGALVIAFMILYYWGSGIIAIVTVCFNILIVLAGLSYFGATLTLPGVAALVLTIGMAVDSNILILERVREELRAGKDRLAALEIGFNKVTSTIVDANVTTLITSSLLAWLGTGAVKGFGVTLTIGIFGTMFCSLIASRWIMELLVSKNILKRMVGFELFSNCKFKFLDYRKPAFVGSWCLVTLGIFGVTTHWNTIFGVDFVGGDEVTMSYTQELTVADVDKVSSISIAQIQTYAANTDPKTPIGESYASAIAHGSFGEVTASFQTTIGTDDHALKLQTRHLMGQSFADALQKAYPDAGLSLLSVQQIGPAVGKEVAESAIISLLVALLGIGLYVALRFEWGYGIGAVVATIHDGAMTVGMFVLFGEYLGLGSGQFTSPMIAAILMVLGYSINDTIVVFDRIREELELNPTMTLRDIVHLAINRTLARTLLTSITTFLATFALFLFAAGVVVDFALVFLIGIFTGTFSSIFIASPVFYWYHKGDRRKVEEEHKEPVYDWHSGETDEEPANS